jgi:hypothetical protein
MCKRIFFWGQCVREFVWSDVMLCWVRVFDKVNKIWFLESYKVVRWLSFELKVFGHLVSLLLPTEPVWVVDRGLACYGHGGMIVHLLAAYSFCTIQVKCFSERASYVLEPQCAHWDWIMRQTNLNRHTSNFQLTRSVTEHYGEKDFWLAVVWSVTLPCNNSDTQVCTLGDSTFCGPNWGKKYLL